MLLLWFILIIILQVIVASKNKISCCLNGKLEMICFKENCKLFNFTNYGEIIVTERKVTINPKLNDCIANTIAKEGLKVFQNITTLNVGVSISYLNDESFRGINVEELKVKSKNISKCTFGGLSKLKYLTITGISLDMNFHKDVFSGLRNLKQLELRNMTTIYTYPVNRDNNQSNIACRHYLCALKNLIILRMEIIKNKCDLTFSGIPEKTEIKPFYIKEWTGQEKDALCPMTRHDCHNDDNLKCGLTEVCDIKVNIKIASSSVVFVSIITLIVIFAVIAAIGVTVWVYQVYFANVSATHVSVAV